MALRAQAREAVSNEVRNAATKQHKSGCYETLHIYHDGEVRWTQHISQSDDIIDDRADRFQAVPSVITAGLGSVSCNCDYCRAVYDAGEEAFAAEKNIDYNRDDKYASQSEAIEDAVSNDDLADLEAAMLAKFDEIPVGYFDDEADESDGGDNSVHKVLSL